jgi:hypothetical protein
MRAGIQNNLISPLFPGFRVSPTILRLARNDRFVQVSIQPSEGGDSQFIIRQKNSCRRSHCFSEGDSLTLKPYRPDKSILACILGSATQIFLDP